MTQTKFAELGLSEKLLRALASADYKTPTPIQAKAIPLVLNGRDLLGIAQTGTGKTAAFTLPLLQKLNETNERARPKCARALILAPTRELILQISDSLKAYGRNMRVRQAVVMGGVGARGQISALKSGVDVLLATPGRLLDLIQQRHIDLSQTDFLILDEADRMLDMGFIRDVRKIASMLPKKRQTLLFSATMPNEVMRLAQEVLNQPERVEIFAKTVAVDRIDQFVHHLEAPKKRERLVGLLSKPEFERVIVFTRTKHGADKVVKFLDRAGIRGEALHGNKSQNARQRALENFRDGRSRVLVATDIASRGIDVDNITHVINYELPNIPESYVHRIGRTARAGTNGIAISFCDGSERPHLRLIERLIKQPLQIVGEAPAEVNVTPIGTGKKGNKRPADAHNQNRNRRRRKPSRRFEKRAA